LRNCSSQCAGYLEVDRGNSTGRSAGASPLGAKVLGELTAISVASAIANAVYHATGKRIRYLPLTVEKML
jgi:CO/xanthine dehydrogenase Mo-binding subunit